MLNVLSLFSGIGAFEMALSNLNIHYNLVYFCEIDKYASKVYSKLHKETLSKNLGDITKIDIDVLNCPIDLLVHGSPCQDFSISGKGKGGDENSGTRSSLMWYSVKIIKKTLPKYVVWENVGNILSPKHKHNFDKYLDTLKDLGYTNHFKILNCKDFSLPQSRNRVFVVSIRNDVCNRFSFDKISISNAKVYIKDFIDEISNIEDKYFVKRPMKPITTHSKEIITVGEVSNKGSQAGKVYSIDGLFPTICACTHGYAIGYIYQDEKVRMLMPNETFKMMGFPNDIYDICKELNISNTQMYKMCGNSIPVTVLESIFAVLFENEK